MLAAGILRGRVRPLKDFLGRPLKEAETGPAGLSFALEKHGVDAEEHLEYGTLISLFPTWTYVVSRPGKARIILQHPMGRKQLAWR